jgi:hypothetical protein
VKVRAVKVGDVDVVGYLNQRPIAIAVAWAFGSHGRRIEVRGYHRRVHGVNPDRTAIPKS